MSNGLCGPSHSGIFAFFPFCLFVFEFFSSIESNRNRVVLTAAQMRVMHALCVLLPHVPATGPHSDEIDAGLWFEMNRPSPGTVRVFLDVALSQWCCKRPQSITAQILPYVSRFVLSLFSLSFSLSLSLSLSLSVTLSQSLSSLFRYLRMSPYLLWGFCCFSFELTSPRHTQHVT